MSQGEKIKSTEWARVTTKIISKKDDYCIETSSDNKDFINDIVTIVLYNDLAKQKNLIT